MVIFGDRGPNTFMDAARPAMTLQKLKKSHRRIGCYYSGGEKEKNVLGKLRRRWKTLHISDPLTPEEVGLMLRALGTVKMFICMWL
ncbi:O-fucosyltransferase 6-like isoform X2 [Apium graveolens]|uniref:O-fucosyltransferase 6-like isoform X2 n=1 Tax=Apium graveolens TaxID=4045 RepID=UPI003D790C78